MCRPAHVTVIILSLSVSLYSCATSEPLASPGGAYDDVDDGGEEATGTDAINDSANGDAAEGDAATGDAGGTDVGADAGGPDAGERDTDGGPDAGQDVTQETSTGDGGAETLAITTNLDSCAVAGDEVSLAFQAAGAGAGAIWTATGLPPELTLTPSGILSGTHSTIGTFTITVRVQVSGEFGEKRFIMDVAPRLLSALGEPGYLEGRTDGVDVLAQAVAGETASTECTLYYASGGGTRPDGVSQTLDDPTGCTLVGDASDEDVPGVYGMMVQVNGACDQRLYVPVLYRAASCASGPYTVDPPETDIVRALGAAEMRRFTISDVDGCALDGDTCNCTGCVRVGVDVTPLFVQPDFTCDGAEVCLERCEGSDCFIPPSGGCPSQMGFSQAVETLGHDPVLPPGGEAAWVTYDYTVTYSGANREVETCGDKVFRCHLDILEH